MTVSQTMLLRLTLTLLVLFTSATVTAKRWYEIEVILFEQATEERLNNETWDNQPPLPDLSKLKDIFTPEPHLSRIQNLCYQGNYYQVSTIPGVAEVTDEPPATETDLGIDPETTEPPIEELVLEEPFVLLSDSEHELENVYAQLRRRRGYRMLFHEAWRQPMQSKREAIPLRFYAGANYGDKFNYAGQLLEPPEPTAQESSEVESPVETTATPELKYQSDFRYFRPVKTMHGLMNVDRYFGLSERQRAREDLMECQGMLNFVRQQEETPVWQVDGYIHFYAERFRHIETNLSLRIPGTEEVSLEAEVIEAAANELVQEPRDSDSADAINPGDGDWQLDESLLTNEQEKLTEIREILAQYTLQQSRRIIDEKIHYFDHPLLGLIVQMRLYDPEEAAREAAEGTSQP